MNVCLPKYFIGSTVSSIIYRTTHRKCLKLLCTQKQNKKKWLENTIINN